MNLKKQYMKDLLNNEKDLPKKNLNNKLNEIHIQELVNE